MIPLKEDGSLDIEAINKLPFEEYEVAHLAKGQRKEDISKRPARVPGTPLPVIPGALRKELASGKLVDAWEVLRNIAPAKTGDENRRNGI